MGYLQPLDGAGVSEATIHDEAEYEVNAVSSSDNQFLGLSSEEVLAKFNVGKVDGPAREKLGSLLQSFPEVFSTGYADIGCYKGGEVELELEPGTRPKFAKPYPVPLAKEQPLRDQLGKLEAGGVIAVGEPCDWNSPVVLVSKGNRSEFRIVQDMREINKSLLPKKFVLPSIDEFLYSLHGWKIASSLDIKHAFWNLRLSENSSKICAFHALGQTYYPQRMPMGCAQSSYFLHVMMHRVLGDVPGVSIYADDVLLTSPDVESHLKLLHTVLERLQKAGLKLSPEKCSFGMGKLSYLGHQISPDGVSVDPERVRCIAELQRPASVKEAKRLYGFFAWFRKFIPRFSTISAPLVTLANSDSFFWSPELDEAFCCLRDELLSNRVLAYPTRGDDRFILYTDSSTVGSGQILCQVQNGVEKVIAFNGSKYSKSQSKWTIYELEVFSFITGLKKFYKYLAGKEFTWICDCRSALKILNNSDEVNPRIVRWRVYASQFKFTTEHRAAKDMQHVDMISRIPEGETGHGTAEGSGQVPQDSRSRDGSKSDRASRESGPSGPRSDSAPFADTGTKDADGARSDSSTESDATCFVNALASQPEIIWYQKHDKTCRALVHRLKNQKWPKFCSPSLKKENIAHFFMRDGILCRQVDPREPVTIVWPVAKRFEIMHRNHDVSHHSHCGHDKMHEKLSRAIWYPGLRRDCKNYVDSCRRCSAAKDDKGPPLPPLVSQSAVAPGEVLVIDIVHMPASRTSGKTLVLTCVDKFTGFLTHYPLETGTTDGIVDALSKQFLVFGPPKCIETDAGSNFKSQKLLEFCQFWDVILRHAVGGHHEGIGKVERRHRDIKRRLRAMSDRFGTDWENHLPSIIFSLNNEVSSTHGYSPYFLFFMRHMSSPLSDLVSRPVSLYSDDFVHEKMRTVADTLKQAHAAFEGSQMTQKKQYDQKNHTKLLHLKPGDEIRVKNVHIRPGVSRKMLDPWSSVYVVVQMVGRRHVDYLDPRTGVTRRTHVKFVKPVVPRDV